MKNIALLLGLLLTVTTTFAHIYPSQSNSPSVTHHLAFRFGALQSKSSIAMGIPTNFKQIYFFGDSLSDAGNYKGNYPDKMGTQSAPVTNWENGKSAQSPGKKTWADMFAENYHLRLTSGSLTSPQGNDWAVSGATTTDVYNQTTNFLNANKTYPSPNSTLYVIWAGSNDLLQIHNKSDVPKVLIAGMFNLANTIQSLHNVAHAKNFLIINIPDISTTPLFTNPKHIQNEYNLRAQMLSICNYWNMVLFGNKPLVIEGQQINPPLYLLKQLYPDLNIYTFDAFTTLDNIVADPAKYGFQKTFNLTSQQAQNICGANSCINNQLEWYYAHFYDDYGSQYSSDPDEFIFHNAIHPTTHTSEIMASQVMQNTILFQ